VLSVCHAYSAAAELFFLNIHVLPPFHIGKHWDATLLDREV
jgi:hypothetical protein